MIVEHHDNQIIVLFPFKNPKIKEAVAENEDGTYTIMISDSLSPEGRLRAYQHALYHIEHNDFRNSDVQQIEAAAHGS